jgi:hypothetical protein
MALQTAICTLNSCPLDRRPTLRISPDLCRIPPVGVVVIMKDSLEHLPERKRDDLRRLTETIREMCNDVLCLHRRSLRPELSHLRSRLVLLCRTHLAPHVRDRIPLQNVPASVARIAVASERFTGAKEAGASLLLSHMQSVYWWLSRLEFAMADSKVVI